MAEGVVRAAVTRQGYYDSERTEVAEIVPAAQARILDVGCGGGAFGALLKRRGAKEVVGLEVIPEVAERARQRLDAVHVLDLDATTVLPVAAESFDVVVCADVLEHLVDPWRVLRMLRGALTPTGLLVVSLPNVRHESVVLPLLVDGIFAYQDIGILDRTHLRFFTLREAAKLLETAGFRLQMPIRTVRNPPSKYLATAAELVSQLGGNAAAFREEATVVQYLLTARPAPAATST